MNFLRIHRWATLGLVVTSIVAVQFVVGNQYQFLKGTTHEIAEFTCWECEELSGSCNSTISVSGTCTAGSSDQATCQAKCSGVNADTCDTDADCGTRSGSCEGGGSCLDYTCAGGVCMGLACVCPDDNTRNCTEQCLAVDCPQGETCGTTATGCGCSGTSPPTSSAAASSTASVCCENDPSEAACTPGACIPTSCGCNTDSCSWICTMDCMSCGDDDDSDGGTDGDDGADDSGDVGAEAGGASSTAVSSAASSTSGCTDDSDCGSFVYKCNGCSQDTNTQSCSNGQCVDNISTGVCPDPACQEEEDDEEVEDEEDDEGGLVDEDEEDSSSVASSALSSATSSVECTQDHECATQLNCDPCGSLPGDTDNCSEECGVGVCNSGVCGTRMVLHTCMTPSCTGNGNSSANNENSSAASTQEIACENPKADVCLTFPGPRFNQVMINGRPQMIQIPNIPNCCIPPGQECGLLDACQQCTVDGNRCLANCATEECRVACKTAGDKCTYDSCVYECKTINDQHLSCVNKSCTLVEGKNADQCGDDTDCIDPNIEHLICVGNACVAVEGAGPDECTDASSCIDPSSSIASSTASESDSDSSTSDLSSEESSTSTKSAASCPPCMDPPPDNTCIGLGLCGCGPYICPNTSSSTESTNSAESSTQSENNSEQSSAASSDAPLCSEPCSPGPPGPTCVGLGQCGCGPYICPDVDDDGEFGGNGPTVDDDDAPPGPGSSDDDDDNSGNNGGSGGGDDDDDSIFNTCGNGILEPGEQCEFGPTNYCSQDRTCDVSACTCYPNVILPSCGNGTLEPGEQCEVGPVNYCSKGRGCDTDVCTCVVEGCFSSNDCPSGACIENSCGPCTDDLECEDGLCRSGRCVEGETLIAAEENIVAAASQCGNGILEPPEECDDNNRRENDGCSTTCLLEFGICGDGKIQSLLGEQCESSLHDSSLPYSCNNCQFASPLCGNGALDEGEECDRGPLNSSAPDAECRVNCSLARCGDGIVDSVEECDDGNRINNDGCDRRCHTEDDESSVVAADVSQQSPYLSGQQVHGSAYQQQQFPFPQQPNYQQLPYQLPLASLQPLIQGQGPVGDTGPAAVAVIGAGAAAGISWIRRKRK